MTPTQAALVELENAQNAFLADRNARGRLHRARAAVRAAAAAPDFPAEAAAALFPPAWTPCGVPGCGVVVSRSEGHPACRARAREDRAAALALREHCRAVRRTTAPLPAGLGGREAVAFDILDSVAFAREFRPGVRRAFFPTAATLPADYLAVLYAVDGVTFTPAAGGYDVEW